MENATENREAEVTRKTKETDITVAVRLGARETSVNTGIGFFDHMLHAASFHGKLGLTVNASGDLNVDYHHVVEDVGLVMGKAIRKTIGPEPSIVRFGSALVPMDDALSQVAVDVSGRGGAYISDEVVDGRVRDFSAALIRDFMKAFAREAGITIHVRVISGEETHHRLEAVFKAFGLSLSRALTLSKGNVPSTKGTLGVRE